MLHVLVFLIQLGLVVAIGVFLAETPGQVRIEWHGYIVETSAAFLVVAVLAFLLIIVYLDRIWRWLWNIPLSWSHKRRLKKRDKGLGMIAEGFAALAGGDHRQAEKAASRAMKLLPEQGAGLPVWLRAQARLLGNDTEAAESDFRHLMADKKLAKLGIFGLLREQAARGNWEEVRKLALKGLQNSPRQAWLVRLLVEAELQRRDWDGAESAMNRAGRIQAYDPRTLTQMRVALNVQRADEAMAAGMDRAAHRALKTAYKLDPHAVAVAQRFCELYLRQDKRRRAVHTLEKIWPHNPHPDLGRLWVEIGPKRDQRRNNADEQARLEWAERLVRLNSDTVEGYLSAARTAMDIKAWDRAQKHLEAARALADRDPRPFRLSAQLEEHLGNLDEARRYRARAEDCGPEPAWICSRTGRIYDRWQAVAMPHGDFNTIVWTRPGQAGAQQVTALRDFGAGGQSLLVPSSG